MKENDNTLGDMVQDYSQKIQKYVVFKREVHNNFCLVEADSPQNALLRAERGDGKTMFGKTEFVRELPVSEWKVETLKQGVLDNDESPTNT